MAGRIVPAAAHRHLEAVGAGERERGRHVGRAGAANDDRRPPVDEGIEAAPRLVVAGIDGRDHGTGGRAPQLGQVLVGEHERVDAIIHNTSLLPAVTGCSVTTNLGRRIHRPAGRFGAVVAFHHMESGARQVINIREGKIVHIQDVRTLRQTRGLAGVG